MRFILDGEVRHLERVDPTQTVLEYLRCVERRSGTKEGCAEGDCGACTVVLGELHEGRVRYRAVNACLLFVPVLDGKALFTVESLRRPGEALHPVQQALVEANGSQCGFCTPGFVMSLFALLKSEQTPSRRRIDDALAGNLCRCTGYRPIVDAVRRASTHADAQRSPDEARLAGLLASIARQSPLTIDVDGRSFSAPRSFDELAAVLERRPEALLLAGGTDVGLWVTKQHRALAHVVYLGAIPELGSVTVSATHLEIGAAAPYADVHAVLGDHHADFGEIVRRIGSQQIRNAGTLGGNVANASPIGDTIPALMSLEASVVLRQGKVRRELPIDDFIVGYRKTALRSGEIVERVRVPIHAPERQFRAYKVSKRFDQDISAVCGAFAVEVQEGRARHLRIAYGGMAATPVRARRCEDALRGRPWTEASVEAALPVLGDELSPLTDMRASSGYRRLVAANLLRKFQLETSGRSVAVRLEAVREDA